MRKDKSFTLVELMVVLAIFVVVFGIILALLSIGQASWQSASSKIIVTQELRRGMEYMVRELSQAGNSTISLAIGGTSNSISFKMPQDLDGDGTILFSNNVLEGLRPPDPFVTYALTYDASLGFNQLTRTMGASSSVLANYLTALQFNRNSSTPNIIEINISAQKISTFGRTLSGNLNGRVILRN